MPSPPPPPNLLAPISSPLSLLPFLAAPWWLSPRLVGLVTIVQGVSDPEIPGEVPGKDTVLQVLGILKWFGLAGCVASFFIGGAVWGLSQANGVSTLASQGRRYAVGGAAGAVVIGIGPTLVDRLSQVSMVVPGVLLDLFPLLLGARP